jgi:hypothetical protein
MPDTTTWRVQRGWCEGLADTLAAYSTYECQLPDRLPLDHSADDSDLSMMKSLNGRGTTAQLPASVRVSSSSLFGGACPFASPPHPSLPFFYFLLLFLLGGHQGASLTRQIVVEALVALIVFLPGTTLMSGALQDVTYRGELAKR